MSRRVMTAGGLVLGVVLLLALNMTSSRLLAGARLDLTENELYTLSQGTRNIIGSLKEPVNLRLFLSRKQATRLPGISSYTQRVVELLRQYERDSSGKIRLSVIDPEPFSEEEDRAVAYGLRGVSMDDGEGIFYFGLVGTSSTDDQEVIPFFSPNREELLEHDITKLVYQLSDPKQRVVGLLSTLPVDKGPLVPGQGGKNWVVIDQLRQLFEVRSLETDVAEIPEDVDVLMIIHPKALGDQTLYAIDQFVLSGGRAVVYVDSNPESERSAGGMLGGVEPGASDLSTLFKQWGIELIKGKVAADIRFAERVRYNRESRSMVTEYPVWMNLPPTQFNKDDVITSELGNLFFATPGALRLRTGDGAQEGVTVTPLVETSDDAMLIDAALLSFLQDPTALVRQYKPGGSKLLLAARVSGRVKTAFPGGRPVREARGTENKNKDTDAAGGEAKDSDAKPPIKISKDPINLIVVADVDMLNDRFWARTQDFLGTRIVIPTAANGNFAINAVESLLGSNDLISVRSRGQYQRPFTRVERIQQNAELQFRQKEQELVNRLQEAEQKLLELEKSKQSDDAPVLSFQQQKEIERFTDEKLRIRKDLREVRRQLYKDIERLEAWTKFINIGLMPLLIGIGGTLIGLQRVRRRRRSVSTSRAKNENDE